MQSREASGLSESLRANNGAGRLRPMMHRTLFLLPLVLLGACASHLEDTAERARTALVGLDEAGLKRCLGEPLAIHKEGGNDLWLYFRETSRSATAASDTGYTPTDRGSSTYDYYRYCEAAFTLQGGRVRAVDFTGRTSTGRQTLEPCGALVERCMAGK